MERTATNRNSKKNRSNLVLLAVDTAAAAAAEVPAAGALASPLPSALSAASPTLATEAAERYFRSRQDHVSKLSDLSLAHQDEKIRPSDVARLLGTVGAVVDAAKSQLADEGKLLRRLKDVCEALTARDAELSQFIRDKSIRSEYRSPDSTADLQPLLDALYHSVWTLKLTLEHPSDVPRSIFAGKSGKRSWNKAKKSSVLESADDMIRAWQELMMNLALAVASSSSGTAKAVSENLHKLAVASGAPDWEDLTLDDGNALFIRAEKYMMGLGVAQSFESAFHSYAQAAARCGHNESMNMLGAMYELGLGVDKNAFDAMKWYEKAAAADNADAMTNLARLLETRKTLEDAAAACSWYLRAAEKGHPDAMTRLGYLLEHGIGQNAPQPELAVQWYRMAATFEGTGATGERAGRIAAIAAVAWGPPNETDRLMGGSHLGCARARAQNALGNCFYKGIGVERNYEEAVMWYKKAADQGAPYAQNNLGICYEEGLGVARDLLMAKSLYKAASEVRHPSGTNNYGYMLLLEGNPLEALRMFHVASALGSADAAFNIGSLYESGCSDSDGPILDQNLLLALRWYEEAAKMDSTKSHLRLATILLSHQHIGDISLYDPDAALYHLRCASVAGSADAKNLLGQVLALRLAGRHEGDTVMEDVVAEAVEAFRSGAEMGHAACMFQFAGCHETGFGVKKDPLRAMRLFEEAERLGSIEAQNRLELLRSLQTRD